MHWNSSGETTQVTTSVGQHKIVLSGSLLPSLRNGVSSFSDLWATHWNFHTSVSHRNALCSSVNQVLWRYQQWFPARDEGGSHTFPMALWDRHRVHPAQPLLIWHSPQPAVLGLKGSSQQPLKPVLKQKIVLHCLHTTCLNGHTPPVLQGSYVPTVFPTSWPDSQKNR